MSAISDKIRDAEDLVEIPYHVDEWDVDLLLISPTLVERDEMMKRYTKWTPDEDGVPVASVDTKAMRAEVLIACAHDPETRERAFLPSDAAMLQGKNGVVVDRAAEACMPLVGFGNRKGDTATDPGKDASSTTPSAATASDSPTVLVGP